MAQKKVLENTLQLINKATFFHQIFIVVLYTLFMKMIFDGKLKGDVNMEKNKKDIRQLHVEMDHVLNDGEHFLLDLKGEKNIKGLVKKDIRQLKEHLLRLVSHLAELEEQSGS